MAGSSNLAKAQLVELSGLDKEANDPMPGGRSTTVQFNPDTLKVSFANQIATPDGAGSQRGSAGRQFVGKGTTKLAVQLWFDVTHPSAGDSPKEDVRDLTKEVAYFITPQQDKNDKNKFLPPAVRFLWGSFSFDGIMESLEETLELFSSDGRPIRASMSFALTQQKIAAFSGTGKSQGQLPGTPGAPGGGPPGTTPLTPATAGASVQSLVDALGRGADWQSIAAANGIENPRLLQPGQLLNLNPGTNSRRVL